MVGLIARDDDETFARGEMVRLEFEIGKKEENSEREKSKLESVHGGSPLLEINATVAAQYEVIRDAIRKSQEDCGREGKGLCMLHQSKAPTSGYFVVATKVLGVELITTTVGGSMRHVPVVPEAGGWKNLQVGQ
ncbi:MAG TPA: hypothetical protein VLJ17_24610 [Xanthobacteraceae bacterium]|nr:hypothetical protein [Xanthobacteraceae bacterium]